ncbi:hypothetical protein I5462_12620 [Citrobacter freundii]|uniref:cag pathogenicity island Cag12 family protein n=1 Tax=Citrobacter freundii TaxID=546 RepID=UPI000C7F7FFA|nr:cag pathogenicity island Cag12 family protein [Citrobacter freundii]EMB4337267.1 hypothetical protein [Citrobacter freundii]MBJ9041913.1 hypothetical protein [Citrobacter freundii]NTY76587.1 hypothetical protein [Citrobacter freundii]NUA13035.1 hypothetical protein [Citrobacter freundii]PMD03462.1 hypothetical protein CJ200_02060 [Citrobacter freundii]
MRIVNLFFTGIILMILSGCSSPPEPARPEWNKPGAFVNSTLPQWSENRLVVPSPETDGHWSTAIIFNPDIIYLPAVWYAVAHSERISVYSPDGAGYFRAKYWLRKHGYTGVITFHPEHDNCLACNRTEITLYRQSTIPHQ